MNCLIVDDEPLARIGMERLIRQYSHLKLLGSFKYRDARDKRLGVR